MPPVYRLDLRQEVDLYEEIVRICGSDKIPPGVPSWGSVGGCGPEDDAVPFGTPVLTPGFPSDPAENRTPGG